MPPVKRHPIESLIPEALDTLDAKGLDGLNDRMFQVALMHYFSGRNGNGRTKRWWGGLVTVLGSLGAGVGFGIAKALGA